jgi:glycosyltransferase involved in cell wall biosynthesis
MLVLLDCRPLQYIGSDSEKSHLIISAAAALARDKGVKWLFLVDHSYEPGLFPGLPDMPVLIRRAFPGRAGWKLWYDWQIPGIVRKFKCNAVMLTGGVAAGVPDLPQFLWMPVGVDPKEAKDGKQELPLYAGRLAASLQHAEAIFCFSEKDRVRLAGYEQTEKEKLFILRPTCSSTAVPLTGKERERIKEAYAGGREYFFVDAMAASEEEVVQLLKAYSLFKKRQHSNLRLVVSGRRTPGLRERLKRYKYGDEVFFFEPMTADDHVLDAAYAAFFPFEGDSLGMKVVRAWQTGVPTLIRTDGRLREMAGEAALGVIDADPGSLAVQMMSIYKDESLRSSLIQKGFIRARTFDPDPGRQLAEVWNVISRICMV